MRMIKRDVGKRETQLQRWGGKLDDLVLKTENSGVEAVADHCRRIDAPKTKRKAVMMRFGQLNAASRGPWENIQIEIDKAWNDLALAIHQMADKQERKELNE